MRARTEGFSLPELLAALTLTGLLAATLATVAVAQMRLARGLAQRAAALDAERTLIWVLGGELRRAHASDVRSFGPDSLALRVFRGRGIRCGGSASTVLLRYRGDRALNPDKDSLLAYTAVHGWTAVGVSGLAAAAAACVAAPGEDVMRVQLTDTSDAPIFLAFESGTYFVSNRALRYRVGAEGRQPLTAEVFATPPSRVLRVDTASAMVLFESDAIPPRVRTFHFPPAIE